jgi:hypothetical protein
MNSTIARRPARGETAEAVGTPIASRSPPDQDAGFEELMAAPAWTRDNPGDFVDTAGAAEILGVMEQWVGRLASWGALSLSKTE